MIDNYLTVFFFDIVNRNSLRSNNFYQFKHLETQITLNTDLLKLLERLQIEKTGFLHLIRLRFGINFIEIN